MPGCGGVVPKEVDRKMRTGNEKQVGPVGTQNLISEVDIAVTRIQRFRRAPHVVSIARFRWLNGHTGRLLYLSDRSTIVVNYVQQEGDHGRQGSAQVQVRTTLRTRRR